MTADLQQEQLIEVIEQLESDGDVDIIGDHGKAYGVLQIWQCDLDDFKKWNYGKAVVFPLEFGGAIEVNKLTLDDLLGKKGKWLSEMIFVQYMAYYATEKRLGRPVTDLDRARIWNGGPNGWRNSSTRLYAWRFQNAIIASTEPVKKVATDVVGAVSTRRKATKKASKRKKKK